MPESITDHSKDSQLGTPDIPASQVVFCIHATTRINAPAALVFRTLRNTDTWRDWNKYCPRVDLTLQPPEDDDEATLAEIQELVRNTSVAGSVDSAITDGAATSGGGLIGRRMSVQEEEGIRLSPPPVTKERLRASIASQGSRGRPSTGSGRPSVVAEQGSASAQAAQALRNVTGASTTTTEIKDHAANNNTDGTNGSGHRLSGAQKFQQAQEQRKASIASGKSGSNDPPPPNANILVEAPHDPNVLMPAPPTPASASALYAQTRRSSVSAATKKRMSINALYGEPSVRIQMGTKMTLHLRWKVLPTSLASDREMAVVVTEVSRPDDNEENTVGPGPMRSGSIDARMAILDVKGNVNEEGMMKMVERSATHVPAKQPGVYRVVWGMQEKYSPPKSYPKWMLQGQRVHEIRKVVDGAGREGCVYEDWEVSLCSACRYCCCWASGCMC